jgi:uncharacterized protein (DUF58 family)
MTLPVPTRRLAAVVAASIVVLLVLGHPRTLLVVEAALVLAALVDLALAVSPRRTGFERVLPASAVLGARATLTWRLSHERGRAVTVAVADELAPSLRASTRRCRARLRAGDVVEVDATLRPTRRGRFEPSAVVVRTEGPLGLLARQRTRQVPGQLQVYPPFPSRDEAELKVRRARRVEIGLRTAQGRGGGTEFDQLREYTPDDESRRIDWAATARTGRPIVRTYRAEQNQVVVCLLDNGRVMAGRVAGVPRVEHAMDAAMALTSVAARLGDRAGLVAFDVGVRAVVPPGSGARQVGRVADVFPELEPVLAESDYAGAFAETLARFRRRAMLVVLTDLVEQAMLESLLPALPLLASRHRVVVAAVHDPAVVRWARAAPDDAEQAYRAAAAIDALEERSRAAARLQGLGAMVVDAEPGALAGKLCDVYLDAKATGAL